MERGFFRQRGENVLDSMPSPAIAILAMALSVHEPDSISQYILSNDPK